MSEGKHHIGDFIPPKELQKFMETFKVTYKYKRNKALKDKNKQKQFY